MKIYPIGTVLKVGDDPKLLMIIARFPLTIEKGTKGYYDYAACLYPFGLITTNMLYFNQEDITEVVFEGFINQREEELQKYLLEQIPSIKYPKFNIHE